MNEREKKLLSLLGIAGFVILNVFLFKMYQTKLSDSQREKTTAESQLRSRKILLQNQESHQSEVDWLSNVDVKPVVREEAEATLAQYAESEAKRSGLDIKRQKLLPAKTDGVHFHRVKAEFQVGGTEASLYRWLDRLYDPNKFRSVTYMRTFPQRKDDTKVDCVVVVERWFVPKDATEQESLEEEGA